MTYLHPLVILRTMSSFLRRFIVPLGLAVLIASPVPAAEAGAFFGSEDLVSIRLEAPIVSLKKQRRHDPEWLAGKAIIKNSEGLETAFTVQLKARGHFRRKPRTCTFPPFWLNFKKSEVKGTLFDGLDKVKVVSHCRVGIRSYEPFIHTEYLAYKTYNILTDRSFKVRLANIHYVDTDRGKDLHTYDAFFIEHVDSFEDRLDVIQVKDQFILPSRYDERELCRAEMFQFFVGTTDFSFFVSEDECCHNGKAFALKGAPDALIPVPYDFDMSGIVNPPYAEPNENFEIASVKQRLYRGMGVSKETLEQTGKHYLRKKIAR